MKKAIALLGFLLVGGWTMGQLRITEICPRPEGTDPNGKESGWIELTNTSETETVNLADYALIRFNRGKKDSSKNRLALLPKAVGPKERAVVYASEAYANFKDIGGSGKVELFGELTVYPVKINPKKYPTVRLYKGNELVDTFEVPVDLADGKSFAPGQIRQVLLDEATPYRYRLSGEETWQSAGSGCLAVVADREMVPVPGALAVTLMPDSEAFTEGSVVAGGVARTAWDLSSNTGKKTGLTAPAETLAEATEAYTLAFWFKAEKTGGTGDQSARILFDYRPSKSTDNYSGVVVVLTGEGQLEVQPRMADKTSATFYSDTAADYGDGAWHHVVLSIGRKQGDPLRLWADGEKCVDALLAFDVPLRTDVHLCFGRAYDSTAWGLFNGALSDIRFYPRALEAAEALALFGEDGAAREITGPLTKAEAITEADGLYTFPDSLANATSAQLYSTAAAPTLARAGETVDLWLNPSTLALSTGKPIALVDARSDNNSADGFVLAAEGTGALKIERKGTQQEWIDLGLTLETGAWVHLTLAYDAQSGDCTCYRNGVAVGTFSAVNSYQPPAGKHYFGSSRDSYWSAFKGQLAAPRLFSGVLCAEEVARLHNASPLAAEIGKVFTQGLVEGVQTALPVEALAPVEAQVSFALSDLAATGRLTVEAEAVGGTLDVTLDGQAIAVGSAIAAPAAGEHTLAWVLTPAEGVTYATAKLAAQVLFETPSTSRAILPNPTPGAENDLTGSISYGPNIGPEVGKGAEGELGVTAASPAAPGADYAVAYEIHPLSADAGNAIAAVTLLYRADFGEVQEAKMAYNEATGLWEGTIPAAALPAEGHLLRYAARIVDGEGNRWRSPSFCNPDDGYEWFGTLVKGEAATDETLQTFHLFADSTALANMDKQYDSVAGALPLGARVGVFDEQSNTYYDNVRIDLRGNTSAGFDKKSHGLRFSKCQPLTCTNPFDGEEIEVRKTSFIAEYCDPTYIRQALSFWLLRQAGNLTPFDYPVRVQMNGAFYQLAFHSNRFTDELIEDYYGFGEDDGSIGYGYKNVGPFSGSNVATDIEKKTPDDGHEEDIDVLKAFAATLPTATVTEANQAQVTRRVVEAFDLPAWVNYLAAARITQECDDVWGNLSAYYDCLHTDTWMPLAYDLNLSFGQWYFGDDEATGRIGLRATDDAFKSHPLYGGFKILAHKQDGSEVGVGNRALEALFQNEKFRRLYLRRLRTLMDAYLKAPDTAQDATPLWQQALRYKAAIAHLEEQDRTKWHYSTAATGTPIWVWPGSLSLEEGFTDLWENYVVPRRTHLYETHAAGSTTLPEGYGADYAAGIPAAQSPLETLAPNFAFANAQSTDGSTPGFAAAEGHLTITNANAEAVDMSGWVLSGAVVWSLPAGTVVDANGSLTIVADRKAYVAALSDEAKAAAPIILGNATFSEAEEALTLTAADGTVICSASWAPAFELPADEAAAAEVTAAIEATPAISDWLAGLDDAGKAALVAFTGTAEDLTTCYLVNLTPQAAPEVALEVTAFTVNGDGTLSLTGTLSAGGEEISAVNGSVVLEAFSELGGTATEVPLGHLAFPISPTSALPEGARFFRLKLR